MCLKKDDDEERGVVRDRVYYNFAVRSGFKHSIFFLWPRSCTVCVCVLFSLPVARALERGCGRGFHTERGLRRALSSRPPCCQIGQFYFKTKLVQNPSSAVD